MKRKMIALPLALSSFLILGACGDEDTDVEDIEVNDPVKENDAGVENDTNDEDTEKDEVEENEEEEKQDEGSINDSVDDAND